MSTKAKKIVQALRGCQQFHGASTGAEAAVNVLTGARVEPVLAENDDEGVAFLRVTFPGGEPFDVVGEIYLELQVLESIRIECAHGEFDLFGKHTLIARAYRERLEHLRGKYEI